MTGLIIECHEGGLTIGGNGAKADADGLSAAITLDRETHGLGIDCGICRFHIHGRIRIDEGEILDRNTPPLGKTGHDFDGTPPYGRDTRYDMEALHSLG